MAAWSSITRFRRVLCGLVNPDARNRKASSIDIAKTRAVRVALVHSAPEEGPREATRRGKRLRDANSPEERERLRKKMHEALYPHMEGEDASICD